MEMNRGNIWITALCVAAFVVSALAQDVNSMVERSMDGEFFQNLFVNQHNTLRRNVEPEAANMKHVTWCKDLEKIANIRAQNCSTQSNVFGNYQTKLFTMIGENTRFADGFQRAEAALNSTVAEWAQEGNSYDYDTNYCRLSSCARYKQMVHAATYRIGCAYNYCPSVDGMNDNQPKHLITCLYGEAGNVMYELPMGGVASFRPYMKGTACSECQDGTECNEGLCSPSETMMSSSAASSSDASYSDASSDGESQQQNDEGMSEEQLYERDITEWRYEFGRWRRGMDRWLYEMDRYQESTKECPSN